MPSVFTLQAPSGFGEPIPNQDYLQLLGDPALGYDMGVGHHVGISSAMFGDTTSFFADRGLILGSIMVFFTSVTVGGIVGHTFIATLKKLGWREPE